MLGIDHGLTGFDIDPDLIPSPTTMDPAMVSRHMITLNKALELDSSNLYKLFSNPKDLGDVVCDWIQEHEHSHLNRGDVQHTTDHKVFGITHFSDNHIKDFIKVFRSILDMAKQWIGENATCDEKYSTKVRQLFVNQISLKHLCNRRTGRISIKFFLNTAALTADDEEELEDESDEMAAQFSSSSTLQEDNKEFTYSQDSISSASLSIHNGSFVDTIAATSATTEPHQVISESSTSSEKSSRSTFIDSGYHTRAATIDEEGQHEHNNIDITKSARHLDAIDSNLSRKRKGKEEIVKAYKKIKINITNKNARNKRDFKAAAPKSESIPVTNDANEHENLSIPVSSKKPKIIIKNNGYTNTPVHQHREKKIIKIKFNSVSTVRLNLISNWEIHNPCADPWIDSWRYLPTDTEPFPAYIEPDTSTYT